MKRLFTLFIIYFIINFIYGQSKDLSKNYANRVCSFEVLEHVGKQNIDKFLQNFKSCGGGNTIYYLSTPNYDEEVGAAENHTYDSLDGRGKAVQEFSYQELKPILEKYFNIEKIYGTFASQKDYKPLMNEWQLNMFNVLKEYYDTNLLSNIMAPMFPEQSRNILYAIFSKSLKLNCFYKAN